MVVAPRAGVWDTVVTQQQHAKSVWQILTFRIVAGVILRTNVSLKAMEETR